MEHNYHYCIKNPNFSNTGYIVAVANILDKHDRSTPSHYHWKILKCRMIIFSNSSILACPDKKDVKQVHIVFNKVGDDYDKLNSLFIKFSLTQDGCIRATTPDIFQMCLTYTLTAKIAPTWNTLGYNYLINNRDFLTTNGVQEGVQFRISSDEYKTDVELMPVNINFIKSTDDISPGEYVRVLPSLNKAVVEELSKTLPELGSFKSYKDLRRHWKNINNNRFCNQNAQKGSPRCKKIILNTFKWLRQKKDEGFSSIPINNVLKLVVDVTGTDIHSAIVMNWFSLHGYRLPEEETSYCMIRFWRGEPLTYPNICVTRHFPIITPMPKAKEESVLSRFIGCLKSKIPHFLGIPLTIQHSEFQKVSKVQVVTGNTPELQTQDHPISLCTPTQNARPFKY